MDNYNNENTFPDVKWIFSSIPRKVVMLHASDRAPDLEHKLPGHEMSPEAT